MKKIIFLLFFLSLFFPSFSLAKIGVGVGTGKIQIEDKLKPGMSYELPPLTVLNTGDEESDYEAAITYHQDQPEIQPAEKWFSFHPKKFHLKPGDVQIVEIRLNLPLNAKPGDYFAYLESHPVKKSEVGKTAISVAAAAKLYFTVIPANIFQAIYYKIIAFWINNAPWTNIVSIALAAFLGTKLLKKHFNIQINVAKKKGKKKSEIGKSTEK